MLKNYWFIAIRKLWKHKVHSVINILGLTIGVASCLIIFLITHFELSYDRFHPGGDRIYRLFGEMTQNNQNGRGPHFSLPMPQPYTLRKEVKGFEAVSGFSTFWSKVVIPGKSRGTQKKEFDFPPDGASSPIIITDAEYFQIFRYKWLAGNPATSLSDPYRVVLSAAEVNHYFGPITPEEAIGRLVIYNDSLSTYVSGVVQDWGRNTDFGFRDFISYPTAQQGFQGQGYPSDNGKEFSFSQVFVLLDKGSRVTQVEGQFPAIIKKYFSLPPGQSGTLGLQPLSDIHFNEAYHDSYSRKADLPTLYGLMGIAVFILLLAVINFVNLSTAQSLQRTKEVGIRKVLGSRRKDIAWQFLGETFLLTLLAVILSLLITPAVIALLHDYTPPGLTLELSIPTLLFLLGITIGTSLLSGWYPAKVISALLPVLSLKGQATRDLLPNRYLHRILIVFQFSISLVFIIGTVIVARQLHYVLNKDLGFDKDAIVSFRAMGSTQRREVLAQQLRALPGVSIVSCNQQTPQTEFTATTGFTWHGPKDQSVQFVNIQEGDTDYLRLFGIRLLAGRNLFANDSVNEYLVNETMVRALGFRRPQDALGQLVEPGFSKGHSSLGTIVGVVRDFHSGSMHAPIPPLFIDYDRNGQEISIRLAPSARQPETIASVLKQVEKIWRATYPNEKFSYSFLDESIANLYQQEQRLSGLMRLAMIIAISISCMGLLGLVTFTAEQRQKEIGIRKVLGASVAGIFRMLTLDFLWPVTLAFVIATPIAWYFMQGWLQDFVYRTTVPWWIFGICGLAAIVIALVTVSVQALKASVINPIKSLRMD
jgi:putative ABC transport system permease protein